MRDEDLLDIEVPEVIELSDGTISESWNEEDGEDGEDGECSTFFEREEEMEEDGEATIEEENVIMQMELWKELPRELHAHILQLCSMPQLCRLRTACHAWNNLTYKLGFVLKFQPQHTYIFKTPRYIMIYPIIEDAIHKQDCNDKIVYLFETTSDVFDPSTQKSYPIGLGFLHNGERSPNALLDHYQIIAAHRGFLWVQWRQQVASMQVGNPVTRSVVEIPPIRIHGIFRAQLYTYMSGAMTVAKDYSSFTLYVVLSIEPQKTAYLVRFDSLLGEWQEFFWQPMTLIPIQTLHILNEILYGVFFDINKGMYGVFAFDTKRNTWIDMALGLSYNATIDVFELVTTLGRLFCVFLIDHNCNINDHLSKDNLHDDNSIGGDISIEIAEIYIASKEWSTIAIKDEVSDNNVLKSLGCPLVNRESHSFGANIAVVGCGNFIVVASVAGKYIAYDMLNNELKEWSFSRSIIDVYKVKHGMFAMPMTLTLNPVPSVQ